eukprot:scaffold7375_cov268-Pinguiococcus_pyrenoidosus.AAC.2
MKLHPLASTPGLLLSSFAWAVLTWWPSEGLVGMQYEATRFDVTATPCRLPARVLATRGRKS